MKIVQIIDSLRAGGKERQAVELLKGLINTPEISCDLIVMSNKIHYSYVLSGKVRCHIILRKLKKDPTIFFKLNKLMSRLKPDIIHSWSSMCSIYSLPIAKFNGIIFINGFLRDAPPSFGFRDKEWLRGLVTFPLSDAIVANSKTGLQKYKCNNSRSHCIYNGFDFERLNNMDDRQLIKQNLNIYTQFVVGMVATFSVKKDYHTFINAAVMVLEKRNDVTFITIGNGVNFEICKKSIPQKHIKRFLFLGSINKIEEVINIFNIGVLCTNASVHGEGISNSIMEYMALGKPVVATKCGGNDEIVREYETGFLIENGDAIELARRIEMLLDNEALSKNMGKHGKEIIKKYFTIDRMTMGYISLYSKLIQKSDNYSNKYEN